MAGRSQGALVGGHSQVGTHGWALTGGCSWGTLMGGYLWVGAHGWALTGGPKLWTGVGKL